VMCLLLSILFVQVRDFGSFIKTVTSRLHGRHRRTMFLTPAVQWMASAWRRESRSACRNCWAGLRDHSSHRVSTL
jgi:hypothetical protein